VDVAELVTDGQRLTQRVGRPLDGSAIVLGVRNVTPSMAE